MNPLDQFAGQLYLNLETRRRNGQAMPTPVWFVQEGQRLYVRTVAGSGKVKRVRNDPHVRIAVCDRQGGLLGPWVAASAREIRNSPPVEAEVDGLLDKKYGEVKRQLARQAAESGRRYTILEITYRGEAMKNTLRQVIVVLAVLATITINILANALPINGLNTGQISDRFQVYFVPAGYVFSIWGLIYIGLIAYAVYQALPSQRENPRLQATGWWVVLGGLANSAWIFLWHYEQFIGTLGAMLILLATLIAVYLKLGTGLTKVSAAETWAVRVPFSIYLGWISVATIANVSDVLDFLGWNQWELSDGSWMIVILAVVAILAGLVNYVRRDIAYTAVLLWALAGIGVKFPQQGIVTVAIWVAFGLVALTLPGAFLLKRKSA